MQRRVVERWMGTLVRDSVTPVLRTTRMLSRSGREGQSLGMIWRGGGGCAVGGEGVEEAEGEEGGDQNEAAAWHEEG